MCLQDIVTDGVATCHRTLKAERTRPASEASGSKILLKPDVMRHLRAGTSHLRLALNMPSNFEALSSLFIDNAQFHADS
jgi:hypothetical protein